MQKLLRQHDEMDCGAVCFAEIARLYKFDLSVADAREYVKTDKNGTTLYGIAKGAEKIGLHAEALQGTPEEMEKSVKNGEIQCPFIAHVLIGDELLHYIVVEKFLEDEINIFDPAVGNQIISRKEFYKIWTGYLMTFVKTEKFMAHKEKSNNFRSFYQHLQGQYKFLGLIFLLSVLITGVGMISAYAFKEVTDLFISEIYKKNIINMIFGGLLILYIAQSVMQMIRGKIIAGVSHTLSERLTLDYFDHVIDLKMPSIQCRSTGEYMSRMADTDTIRNAISGATVTLLLDTMMIIVGGFALWYQNSRMFIVSLVVVLVYVLIVVLYRKPLKNRNREVMEKKAEVQSFFKESIDGIETVKAAGVEDYIKDKGRKKYERFQKADFENNVTNFRQEVLVQFVELTGILVVLWMGFEFVLAGRMSMGGLIAYYVLMSYFTEPMKNLIQLQPELESALIAADRLQDIISMSVEEHETGKEMKNGDIVFKNIDFRYGGRERVLKNFSLKIEKGKNTAIVGTSGCGKTTLAKLLLKFYEYEKGEIYIGGTDIREMSVDDLRKKIVYVSQENFFFADSIKNNLILGREDVKEEEIIEICKICAVDDFVKNMPMGYDTILAENGADLSGGQKQRLAIARALLQKPEVLILDESTSHLDTITEARIKDMLSTYRQNITCIIIAHRLNTVRDCDKIVVIENGQIAEEGSHEELMKRQGTYCSLWKNQ